jgi:hypothetical protein
MVKGKRGQAKTISQIIGFIIILFVLSVVIVALGNYSQDRSLPDAISAGISGVSNFVLEVTGPLFNGILGLGNDSNTNFLMIITFILMSIIIVGTLDSVNIFGDDKQGGLINLAIGIIVSIIGVRFMPQDMWSSLTAPSSALVATILVAIPFFALIFVTMKVKYPLARKLMWLFYIIFMSYLIFFPNNEVFGNPFSWIYLAFLIGGIGMLIGESVVRKLIFKEKGKYALMNTLGVSYAKRIAEIQKELKKLILDVGGMSPSDPNKQLLDDEIKNLKEEYKELTGKIYR